MSQNLPFVRRYRTRQPRGNLRTSGALWYPPGRWIEGQIASRIRSLRELLRFLESHIPALIAGVKQLQREVDAAKPYNQPHPTITQVSQSPRGSSETPLVTLRGRGQLALSSSAPSNLAKLCLGARPPVPVADGLSQVENLLPRLMCWTPLPSARTVRMRRGLNSRQHPRNHS